jgi:hypothetical protein
MENPMATLNIQVVKGKGTVEIDTDALPDAVYQEALMLGLKVLVNRGTSKITSTTYPTAPELQAAAMEQAGKEVEKIKAGTIKISGGAKVKQASGAVMTEARRLARNLVKDEIKRQGGKVSHYEASEITKAANALIASDPSLVEMAKANIAERDKVKVSADIVSTIHTSDKLIKAAEKRKEESKATSKDRKAATQTAPRAKGQGKPAEAKGHHATH